MSDTLFSRVRDIEPQLIADRRLLHQNPEIGLETPKTAGIIKARLAEMGITPRDCGGRVPPEVRQLYVKAGQPDMRTCSGVVADIGRGSPRVLLKTGTDALPIREQSGLPFASKSGFSHTCAHDFNTAMLLGAARLLKDREEELQGSVRLMFQPGDLLACGAARMIADGVLEGVDRAITLYSDPAIEAGRLCATEGIASASLDSWYLHILGRGGHSSKPEECVDALMIANRLYEALYLLVTREASPQSGATLTAGVHRGGTVTNAVADSAQLQVGLRMQDIPGREHLLERIPFVAGHIAAAWRGEVDKVSIHTRSVYNDPGLLRALSASVGITDVPPTDMAFDFGNIAAQIPGVLLAYGVGYEGAPGLNSPRMTADEGVLASGAALWARLALAALNHRQ